MSKEEYSDQSGDKKYFTIIPNYILNHSTHWDREVYIQLKRITGESGTCWISRANLAKQCGMSVRRVDKSMKYLVEHKWIKYKGKKTIQTKGGAQEVNEYHVADLWKKNIDFYEKGGAEGAQPKAKGGARKTAKGVHERNKGGARGAHKEEPYTEEEPLEEEQEEQSSSLAKKTLTPAQEARSFFTGEECYQEIRSLLLENIDQTIVDRELDRFVSYWTEPNKSGTKQRWELQNTFDVKRRLRTWFERSGRYSQNNSSKYQAKSV